MHTARVEPDRAALAVVVHLDVAVTLDKVSSSADDHDLARKLYCQRPVNRLELGRMLTVWVTGDVGLEA